MAGPGELLVTALPAEVGVARRFAVQAVADLGGDFDAQDSARTLVSELVTNVVLHAGTPAVLTVQDAGDRVRVLVTDGSAAMLRHQQPGADSTTGRGLRLLRALSTDSGTEPSDRVSAGGKTVWFTIRKHHGQADSEPLAEAALVLFDLDLEQLC